MHYLTQFFFIFDSFFLSIYSVIYYQYINKSFTETTCHDFELINTLESETSMVIKLVF